MNDQMKNRRLTLIGLRLMYTSFALTITCIWFKWMAIPTLILATLGPILAVIGLNKEAKRQVKELWDEYHRLGNKTY